MKRLISIFEIMAFVLLFLFTSCSNSNNKKDGENESSNEQTATKNDCDNYLGEWQSVSQWDQHLSISKDGENYLIKISGDGTSFGGDYISPCDNGKLKLTLPVAGVQELTWSSDKQMFYFDGCKFKKVN